MDKLLEGLRAAGEATRLRLLALCAQSQLTVTELTQILGQSQPRVSRHLKLLCDAGLLERQAEGSWALFRLAADDEAGVLAETLTAMLPDDDPVLTLDQERLQAVVAARAEAAAAYFRANAAEWDQIRSLHVPDDAVEQAMLTLLADQPISDLLDVGTGTGRLLELFGPRVKRGIGIDLSREMLAIARAKLDQTGLRNCHVRQADMYHLPLTDRAVDTVTFHHVLHFAHDPAAALAEAARVLKPEGHLMVVDFAPHNLEILRSQHQHRRLGFSDAEVAQWYDNAGLSEPEVHNLEGDPLTVSIWLGSRPAEEARN